MRDKKLWATRSHAFAHRLKELREASGLSVENLAVAAGVTNAAIYKLESLAEPLSNPRLNTLYALADALEVGVPELLVDRPSTS